MSRRLLTAIVLVTALAVAVTAPAGQGAGQPKTKCQQLKTHGEDLAPAHRVKLVHVTFSNSDELRGCVLPDGPVRTAAFGFHPESTDTSFTLDQVKGAVTLVNTFASNEFREATSTYVFNLRTGRKYTIAAFCVGDCKDGEGDEADRALVNAKGQAAAAIRDEGLISIVGFSSTGERRVLDTEESRGGIPPKSLELHGHTVTWKHYGGAKSATLSG